MNFFLHVFTLNKSTPGASTTSVTEASLVHADSEAPQAKTTGLVPQTLHLGQNHLISFLGQKHCPHLVNTSKRPPHLRCLSSKPAERCGVL